MSVVRAARMSSWNEAERLNAADLCNAKGHVARGRVAGRGEPPLSPRKKHKPPVGGSFTPLIASDQYAKQNIHSFLSHPAVAGSDTYDHEFCLMCRVALDGKEGDIPLETRARIVCALRYKQHHGCSDGHYDFQLRRNACWATLKMGRLCTRDDYPYLPFFKCCAKLQLQGVPGFLDDPVVQPRWAILDKQAIVEEKVCGGLASCEGYTPFRANGCGTRTTTQRQKRSVLLHALAAFGISDVASVCAVQDWFAHRRLQQFAKAEEHLKRRCGMVTPGVKGEVERLLRQACG